jgi:uncharacterized cupin superfamily protein
MAKKYVPNGACLVCNKGVGLGKLKVTNHKNVSIYGHNSATEADKVTNVHIPSLGICTITRSVCQPVPLLWSGVQQGVTIGPYHKLLEDSKLSCKVGGQISIYFSVPMAMIAIQRNTREQGKNEVKKLGGKIDDWFKKQFDRAEKINNTMPGSKVANFRLGVVEGVYGGVKGIGEGLVFLNDLKDKAFDASVDAITHPVETYETAKNTAIATKDAVVKAKDWVSNTDNLKRVAGNVEDAGKHAYNWANTPGNIEKATNAAVSNAGEKIKQAREWAGKQSARDWGRYTGRGGFEAALMVTGVGEAKAVVSGAEGANVLAKTGEGANLLSKTAEATKAAEAANAAEKAAEAANAAKKAGATRELGEVVSSKADDVIELAPGSKGNWNKILNNKLKPNAKYKVGDKIYETDELGRVKRVSGEVELGKLGRNEYQQGKSVTLKDGTKGIDEGGHLIGHQFKGAGEQINYVPMKGELNQGAWKKMESDWAKALKQVPPKKVEVDIKNIYDGTSKRPTKIAVQYLIDGKKFTKVFPN